LIGLSGVASEEVALEREIRLSLASNPFVIVDRDNIPKGEPYFIVEEFELKEIKAKLKIIYPTFWLVKNYNDKTAPHFRIYFEITSCNDDSLCLAPTQLTFSFPSSQRREFHLTEFEITHAGADWLAGKRDKVIIRGYVNLVETIEDLVYIHGYVSGNSYTSEIFHTLEVKVEYLGYKEGPAIHEWTFKDLGCPEG